ncbi:hypothetical protein TVAG_230050 [Trichomonas vaginalis G3]|uniref:Importin N-terminal domain-containing protein n=1 Tax=Trichomonas vaginalis (strain ATCC PRA-98 / G3) TaxID=412133 RepID=A2F0Z3_TRIV3|nr:armadillo (ARM) repeat-containing protein family [Trichomonas vaginalis G3]EAY01401.1 hypothetical protein TVAG_230050 [Trichomonas vaginalis G3]KAI5529529.1 armadillo (ARM) repeat-containing protein family [Trichomonas vaginalis G3]|eukprot:XP_001314123.1 hypothetical protein [Trichomonas vaginalis G3]
MNVSPNIDQIELYMSVGNENSPEEINTAQSGLNEWFKSSLAINDSCAILYRTRSERAKFQAATYVKNNIYSNWSYLNPEDRPEIRSSLLESYFNGNNKENINELIAIAIARIAIFSVLEDWQTFLTDCLFDENTPDILKSLKLLLFTKFCNEVESCQFLTSGTKSKLRELCIENTSLIHPCILSAFREPQILPYAINAFNCLLSWCSLSEIVNPEIMVFLCTEWMATKSTQKPTLECLQTIFIKRTDSAIGFRQFAALVVYGMTHFPDPTNTNLPITANKDVLDFLTKFLARFLSIIDLVFFPIPEEASPEDVAELEREANLVLEGLQQFDIKREDFAAMIANLYEIVLSTSPDRISHDFWKLWNDITRKIYFERINKKATHPIYDFFKDFFPMMRESIYEILPSTIDDEGQIPFEVRSCWSMILQIDPENMVQFLNEQENSEKLCIALGSLEFAIDTDAQMQPIFEIIPQLIEQVNDETNEKYLIALLCTVSHSVRFFIQNREVFRSAIQFICECIGLSESVAIAAVNALAYVIYRQESVFFENDLELANFVVTSSDNFFQFLDLNGIRLLYQLCSRLISKFPENVIQDNFFELFRPIFDHLKMFYEDPYNQENIKQATNDLDIISNTVHDVPASTNYIGQIFVPILLEIGPHVYPVNDFIDVSASLLLALGSLMQGAEYSQIEPHFIETLGQLRPTIHAVTSVFSFIAIVRSKFPEVDQHFGNIMQEFVSPALESDDPPYEQILKMLTEFSFAVVDPNFMLKLFQTTALEFCSRDVNQAALECWTKLIKCQSIDNQVAMNIYKSTFEEIMTIAFSILIDQVHNAVYDKIVEFILMNIQLASDYRLINAELTDTLVGIITKIVPQEPRPNMYYEFVTCLERVYTSIHRFFRAITDFLTGLHKVSPVDTDVFKMEEYSRLEFLPIKLDKNPFLKDFISGKNPDGVLRPKSVVANFKKVIEKVTAQIV